MRISDWSSDVCSSDLRDPLVKDVKTFPEKRNTVKTKAPARPAAAVLKLPKMASAFCAAHGARSHALVATAFDRISASASIARPSLSCSLPSSHTPHPATYTHQQNAQQATPRLIGVSMK